MGTDPASEKRRYPRISRDRLPEALRTLTVTFGEGGEPIRAATIDASVSGISFRIDQPVFSIKEYDITLTTGDSRITLRDELVYAKPLDLESSRVSIHFSSQPGLDAYARLVNAARQDADA
jgi:hypothetical protein